jgi:hypothetical protein
MTSLRVYVVGGNAAVRATFAQRFARGVEPARIAAIVSDDMDRPNVPIQDALGRTREEGEGPNPSGTTRVVVAIARCQGDSCDDITSKAVWLSNVPVEAWRVLYIYTTHRVAPSGAFAVRCLRRLERRPGFSNLMPWFCGDEPDVDGPVALRYAIEAIARTGARPPQPRVPPPLVPTPLEWSVGVVGTDQTNANVLANRLCEEPWMQHADMRSLEVGIISWAEGQGMRLGVNQKRPAYVNPRSAAGPPRQESYKPTVAAVAVLPTGEYSQSIHEWLSRPGVNHARVAVCWLLPADMPDSAVNEMTAWTWAMHGAARKRPVRYVYRTQDEGLVNLWDELHDLAPHVH